MASDRRSKRSEHRPQPAAKPGQGRTTSAEETGRGVVNTFTVERETGLADGAGAPGATSVGGLRRDDRGKPEDPAAGRYQEDRD